MSRILLLSLFVLIISCEKKEKYTHLEGQAQGTTFSIIYDSEQNYSKQVDSLLRVIDASMSLWDSTSIISKINANTYHGKVDLHFEKVFQRAMEVSKLTNGYFDITVGPLVKTWGFSYKKNLSLPNMQQVDSLKKFIGYTKVKLIDGKIQKEMPEIALDFNALAQGYTVDVVAQYLEAKGSQNYMVEIGGEVKAKGVNEKKQIWQIGIDKPLEAKEGERPLQTVVKLNNKALATSGSYRKFIMKEGKKYSHAIDPKTGFPIKHNLLSISVIANDCMTADAYATAFLVMGLEQTKIIAKNNNLEWYAIIAKSDDKLVAIKSEKFGN